MALNIYVPPNGASLSENLLYAIWLQGGGGGGGGGPVDIIADHVGLAKNATLNELIDIQVEALTALEALNIDTSDLNKEATQLQVLSAIQGLNFDTSDLNKEATQLLVLSAIEALEFDTSGLNKEETQLLVLSAIEALNFDTSDLNKEATQLEVRDAILGLNFDTSDLNKEVTQLEVRDAILGLDFDTSDLNKEVTQLEVRDAILGLNFDTSDLNKEVTQLEVRDAILGLDFDTSDLNKEDTQLDILSSIQVIETDTQSILSAVVPVATENTLNEVNSKLEGALYDVLGDPVFVEDVGGGSVFLRDDTLSSNRFSVFKVGQESVFIDKAEASVFKDGDDLGVFIYPGVFGGNNSVFRDFFGNSVFVDGLENVSWFERIDLHINNVWNALNETTDTSVFKNSSGASAFKPQKVKSFLLSEDSSFEANFQAELDALISAGKIVHSHQFAVTPDGSQYRCIIFYNE